MTENILIEESKKKKSILKILQYLGNLFIFMGEKNKNKTIIFANAIHRYAEVS